MIVEALSNRHFPAGATQGLIALLFKSDVLTKLTNWRPITLLNVAYKVYAKALQIRVQPILMDIISPDQSAFLPTRFILDNIFLTHETMDWASHSNQALIFLNLDFSKAFDMVESSFLFKAMRSLGFPVEFVEMTQLLFRDASARVKVNGAHSPTFNIHCGVRQG